MVRTPTKNLFVKKKKRGQKGVLKFTRGNTTAEGIANIETNKMK